MAGYLACGRVADCASNAPPGSRSRRFLDVEDQAGDLLLVEDSQPYDDLLAVVHTQYTVFRGVRNDR